jgi:4-amino-4-deoxy-L-arabinose transferase-like glycosyltransferase
MAAALLIIGGLLMIIQRRLAYLIILSAILIIPAYWSMMTALSNANQTFPTAYIGGNHSLISPSVQNNPNLHANERILAYLQSNTQDVKYLVAVPSAVQGVPLVLTSERPVLFMGGFGGSDNITNAKGLMELVRKGDLRYILYAEFFRRPGGMGRGNLEILAWLKDSCLVVPKFSKVIIYSRIPRRLAQTAGLNPVSNTSASAPRNDYLTLYLCP